MRRFRLLFFTLILMLGLFSAAVASETAPFEERLYDGKTLFECADASVTPAVKGYGAYVCNLDTGAVMYRKNADDMVYPASTAKLMTAIVAYENIPDLQTVITASASAVNATKGSNMAIKVGESFTAEQLLNGLLITGANDAANVLAEYVGGSIDGFVGMMNAKAKEIGAEHTTYANPTGLHDANMKTTTKDTAIVARYFYYINALFEMSGTTRYIVEKTPQTDRDRILLNRNLLISRVRSENYYYSPAKGMSLGSTPEAGECIVTCAEDKDGMTYLCVVMNAVASENEESAACADAAALLKACLENFSYTDVLTQRNNICEIPVTLAVDTDYVTLLPESGMKALLPNTLDYAAEISIEPRVSEAHATAPVYEGQVYGEAVVKYRGETILGAVNLAASRDIDKSNVLYLLDRAERLVLGRWFRVFAISAAVLFVFYFGLSVAVQRGKRRR